MSFINCALKESSVPRGIYFITFQSMPDKYRKSFLLKHCLDIYFAIPFAAWLVYKQLNGQPCETYGTVLVLIIWHIPHILHIYPHQRKQLKVYLSLVWDPLMAATIAMWMERQTSELCRRCSRVLSWLTFDNVFCTALAYFFSVWVFKNRILNAKFSSFKSVRSL